MRTAADFLRAMESYLGVTEDPRGSNHTRVGREFGQDGVAWCAETVSVAAAKAGFPWLHTVSVKQIRLWAQSGFEQMTWHPVGTARPDDIFCYHGDEHTGVVSYLDGGGFVSIEGNRGDRCPHVTRRGWSDIAGLARLPFAMTVMAPMPHPPAHPDIPPTHVAVPGTLRFGDTGLEVGLVELRLDNLRGVLELAGQPAWGPSRSPGRYDAVMVLNVGAFQARYRVDDPSGVYGNATRGKLSAVEAFLGIRY